MVVEEAFRSSPNSCESAEEGASAKQGEHFVEDRVLTAVNVLAKGLQLPSAKTRVFKEECLYSLDTAESPDGIFIQLSTLRCYAIDFLDVAIWTTSPKDLQQGNDFDGRCLFLRVHAVRDYTKSRVASEEAEKPRKLAIGVQGGFDPDNRPYTLQYQYDLAVLTKQRDFPSINSSASDSEAPPSFSSLCDHHSIRSRLILIALTDKRLSSEATRLCEALISHSGEAVAEEIVAWEEEVQVSRYGRDLIQLANPVQVPPTEWRCAACGADTNLWLNLSDGYIGCGRKIYSVGGGCRNGLEGAALQHFKDTGSKYPLVVKLGTVTPDSADVFSYAKDEDDRVVDPLLAEHLAHFGINIQLLQKTEQTTAEREIDRNVKHDWTRLLEEDKEVSLLNGKGYIGLTNLGNTCYINSVLQLLAVLPETRESFVTRYPTILYEILQSNVLVEKCAADHLLVQLCALFSALLTDRYPLQRVATLKLCPRIEREDEMDWVTPAQFRYLVGRGHKEFGTKRQQDAEEFFSYLHKLLDANEPPPFRLRNCFLFSTEQRLECLQSHKVRYTSIPRNCVLGLDLPTQTEDGGSQELFSMQVCLDKWASGETLEGYLSPATGLLGKATTRNRFSTFPPYLIVHLRRFYAKKDWTAGKRDCRVEVPTHLDLEYLRATGPLPEEQLLEDNETTDCAAASNEASIAVTEGTSAAPSSCANKCVVPDETLVQTLTSMGFGKNAARRACLAQRNPNPDSCVDWLVAHIEDPDINDPVLPTSSSPAKGTSVASTTAPRSPEEPDDEAVVLVASMGFTSDQARAALMVTAGEVEAATTWLVSHSADLDTAVQNVLASRARGTAGQARDELERQRRDDGKGTYEMLGFVSHMGKNANCGHYVCHVKKNDKWVLFNDCKVAESLSPPLQFGYMYLFKRTDWRGQTA